MNADDDIFDEDEEVAEDRQYLDPPPRAEYNKKYGENHSKIWYLFDRSYNQQQTWMKRSQNIHDFPESFIPVGSEQEKCSHGYVFDPDDNNLVLETDTI